MEFCEALKMLRSELGLTLDELATKIGSTKQALSRYERGECVPDLDVVQRWEERLEAPSGVLTCSNRIPRGFLESYPNSLIDAYTAWQAAEWANMMDGWVPAEGDTAELLQLWRKVNSDFQQAVLNLLRAHLR